MMINLQAAFEHVVSRCCLLSIFHHKQTHTIMCIVKC